MAIIGIDLGTTNSLVTTFKNGTSILIPNQHGEFLTPSVVGLDEKGELIVGKIAKERLITNPELTTSLFKRNMGTNVKVQLGKTAFLPEELSSFVLRQLIADAKEFLGEPIEEVVISVPAYFNAKQRAATKRAGRLAGITVQRLINEPSAAAIACREAGEDDTFIVFDFGGGTLDVSIVETFDNIINICSISGNNLLGGRDFDYVIFEALCEENNLDRTELSRQEQQTLLRIAEKAKIELQEKAEVHLTAIINNQKISMTLTNELLAELSWEIFARMKKPIQNAMNDSGLEAADISKCILVGGSCHMQIVRDYLEQLLRIPVVENGDIDVIVAKGLGIYVGIKQRDSQVRDLVLTDICPFSLTTGVHNEVDPHRPLALTMIARNSILPTSVTKILWTVELGQTEVNVTISQGEQMYDDDNLLLGKLAAKVPKNMKEHEKIAVTYAYDINAILVVTVKVLSTGKEHTLILTGDGLKVSEKEAEKHLKSIQNMQLKLTHNQRQAFLLERAKRIYAEGDLTLRDQLRQLIPELEMISGVGSLRKLNEALDIVENYLEEIEKGTDRSDLFNEDSDFNGFIS